MEERGPRGAGVEADHLLLGGPAEQAVAVPLRYTTTAPSSSTPTSPQFYTGRNAPPLWGPAFNDNDGCDFEVKSIVARSGNNYVGGQPVSLVRPTTTRSRTRSGSPTSSYQPTAGLSRAATTHRHRELDATVKYLGGAWIVDATDWQAFLSMLATTPELAVFHANGTGSPQYVNIHSANADFKAPVASVIAQKPLPIALIGSSRRSFLGDVLTNAGLCGASTIDELRRHVLGERLHVGRRLRLLPHYLGPPRPRGVLFTGARQRDGQRPDLWPRLGRRRRVPTASQTANLARFLDTKGNTVFAEYDSPFNIEATASRMQTTLGVNQFQPDINTAEDCNDQSLPAGSKFRGGGDACLIYAAASQPYAQTGNFTFDGGQGKTRDTRPWTTS